MHVVIVRRQREAEALIGNRIFGKAAIAVVPGKNRRVAQILPLARAIAAVAAGAANSAGTGSNRSAMTNG